MKEKSKGLEFSNNRQQSNILHELNLSRKIEHLCDVVLVVSNQVRKSDISDIISFMLTKNILSIAYKNLTDAHTHSSQSLGYN